jgi:hypothetical protein
MKSVVGRASSPATFGGTGFQPVHRTGKVPVPPKTFQDSHSWAPWSKRKNRKDMENWHCPSIPVA